MKNIIQPVKGTREFYPEVMALRNFIYEKVRSASQAFGYQEWDAPYIESIELYAAKSGEELVKKQSFVFEDRGGDSIALRPELTPSSGAHDCGEARRADLSCAMVVVRSVLALRTAAERGARVNFSSGTLICWELIRPKPMPN